MRALQTCRASGGTHLGYHGDHGAQRLLSVDVKHHHVIPKVAEQLTARQSTHIHTPDGLQTGLEEVDGCFNRGCRLTLGEGAEGLPKQAPCVCDDQLDAFAVTVLAHLKLLLEWGVGQHHHLR